MRGGATANQTRTRFIKARRAREPQLSPLPCSHPRNATPSHDLLDLLTAAQHRPPWLPKHTPGSPSGSSHPPPSSSGTRATASSGACSLARAHSRHLTARSQPALDERRRPPLDLEAVRDLPGNRLRARSSSPSPAQPSSPLNPYLQVYGVKALAENNGFTNAQCKPLPAPFPPISSTHANPHTAPSRPQHRRNPPQPPLRLPRTHLPLPNRPRRRLRKRHHDPLQDRPLLAQRVLLRLVLDRAQRPARPPRILDHPKRVRARFSTAVFAASGCFPSRAQSARLADPL